MFHELSMTLHRQTYQILPLGSVVHTTTVESRTINSGFYGIGLPHLGVEALIAMLNKLLMHYQCDTATGQFMQASYSLFFVELRISFQPLQESYSKYGCRRPSGPKPEIQHDRKGRGMPTLT